MSLKGLYAVLKDALASQSTWGYAISGVAIQTHMGGKQIYSASLVPPLIQGDTPCTPENANPALNSLVVPGCKYRSLLVLTYESGVSVPGPKWRVQAHYSKK